jgi:hypothetical protein
MRRLLALSTLLLLCTVAPAAARTAAPVVTIVATPTEGVAPLAVALHAVGDAASYHWDFGDGASADGIETQHTYAAGSWTVTLTATGSDGSTAQAQTTIAVGGFVLKAATARYGQPVTVSGVVPGAAAGQPVSLLAHGATIARTTVAGDGNFRFRLRRAGSPGPFVAQAGTIPSAPLLLRIHPLLSTSVTGSATVGNQLALVARLQPAGAGSLAIRVFRNGRLFATHRAGARVRLRLPTGVPGGVRVQVQSLPRRDGWLAAVHVVSATVVEPRLLYGSHSSAVAQLQRMLGALHYFVPHSSSFDSSMLDSVYAFQKVEDMPRTGQVDARFWRALATPRKPQPRYRSPANHIEVDKVHQVLYVVRGGKVAGISPVSTAGLPGRFTPVGRFAIYRKVTGWDPSPLGLLYDPMYFTGGYAIHGNPSVPPYPASHGCVRVPMWISPYLYETNPYGETVFVY